MERDAHAGRFLEYGEHNGHLYGTHLDSIRAVIKEGETIVLVVKFMFNKKKLQRVLQNLITHNIDTEKIIFCYLIYYIFCIFFFKCQSKF